MKLTYHICQPILGMSNQLLEIQLIVCINIYIKEINVISETFKMLPSMVEEAAIQLIIWML